jgi:hypothetical protein
MELWKLYFVTFMIERLAGPKIAMRRQLERELERFYGLLLTRTVRNPRSPSRREKLPRLIGFPDRPVRSAGRRRCRTFRSMTACITTRRYCCSECRGCGRG